VSVLVPSFNSGPYVEEAIRSALDQPGADVEVIVQDGGSTDGSLEAIGEFVDSRLLVVSEPDGGQSDALNRALRRASGEFVIWLNADDLLAPGSLVALLQEARNSNLDVVHGNYEIIDLEGSLIKGYTSAPLERGRLIRYGTYIFSGAILIRRTLLIVLGGFSADLHYCMDYELLLRLASSSNPKGSIPEVVAKFRRQPSSKSESSWLPFLRESVIVSRRHGITRLDTARKAVFSLAYIMLRPVWRSSYWLRIRPSKHLGGR